MSFFEHIEELRWHLLRAAVSVLVFTVIVFLLKDFVFQHVILGPTSPDFITYSSSVNICPSFVSIPSTFRLSPGISRNSLSAISRFRFGWASLCPFLISLFEVWRFIRPGLYKKEIKAARGMVFICSFALSCPVFPLAISSLRRLRLPFYPPIVSVLKLPIRLHSRHWSIRLPCLPFR